MSTLIGATLHGKALLLSVSTSRHSDEAWSYRELVGFFLVFTLAREALGTLVLNVSLPLGARRAWPPWADASMGNALGYDNMEWEFLPGTHRRLGNG